MKLKSILILAIVMLFSLSFSTVTAEQPEGVTLEWDANSETDLAGYRIYYGTATRGEIAGPGGGGYSESYIDVGNVTTYMILSPTPLTEGPWFFAATAYDHSGNESNYSNEVDVLLDWTAPTPPGGCTRYIKWPTKL